MTEAERHLWYQLIGRYCGHLKFRKQVQIGSYIVDFICFSHNIIVEVDGGQHASQQDYDNTRTKYVNKCGFRVLRFWNSEIFTNSDGVLQAILNGCLE